MQVQLKIQAPRQSAVDLLAIPLFRLDAKKPSLPKRITTLDRALGGRIQDVIDRGDFRGAEDEAVLVYPDAKSKAKRILLIGLGKEDKCDAEALRRLAGRSLRQARGKKARSVGLLCPITRRIPNPEIAAALAAGAVLGSYRFDRYLEKKKGKNARHPEIRSFTLVFDKLSNAPPLRRAIRDAVALADSQNLARDLSNEPANTMTPVALARVASKMSREVGLKCHVMDVAELKRRKMGGILAVGQGSTNPPRMVVMEHNPRRGTAGSKKNRPTICLIGKGITFDSGGISIKPSAGMHEMKHDMSGAAAVVGAMRAIATLKIPHRVIGLVATAENLPSATAYRPGDIIRMHSGKTVEVLNTDAEGRLVLADALAYANARYQPAAMIDVATLTGACMIALGSFGTGLMGNDEALSDALYEAGKRSGECAWPLPLFEGHKKAMRGSVADLVNVAGREAGASTAGGFLAAFVDETPWAHLDIAGTGWTNKPTPIQPKGATGVGVRLLVDFLSHWKPGKPV